jgi:hypothetical protein
MMARTMQKTGLFRVRIAPANALGNCRPKTNPASIRIESNKTERWASVNMTLLQLKQAHPRQRADDVRAVYLFAVW